MMTSPPVPLGLRSWLQLTLFSFCSLDFLFWFAAPRWVLPTSQPSLSTSRSWPDPALESTQRGQTPHCGICPVAAAAAGGKIQQPHQPHRHSPASRLKEAALWSSPAVCWWGTYLWTPADTLVESPDLPSLVTLFPCTWLCRGRPLLQCDSII